MNADSGEGRREKVITTQLHWESPQYKQKLHWENITKVI